MSIKSRHNVAFTYVKEKIIEPFITTTCICCFSDILYSKKAISHDLDILQGKFSVMQIINALTLQYILL